MTFLHYVAILLTMTGIAITGLVLLGVIRAGNSYTILHIGAVNDAIGSAITLLGISMFALAKGNAFFAVKILLLLCVVYVMNPLVSYVLTKILYFYKRIPMDENMQGDKEL